MVIPRDIFSVTVSDLFKNNYFDRRVELAEKHYPEETEHVKMKAKDEMEYTVLGGVDLGKVFIKSVGKKWNQTKGEANKQVKETPLNKNNIALLKSAKLLKATKDFATRCRPPEFVKEGTILTVYQFSEEDCMVAVDCASFNTVQWLSLRYNVCFFQKVY